MSKDTPILAAQAKDMYIKKSLTFKEIASRLGVNERTVRNWRDKDGHWDRDRQAYIDSRTSFHEDLYDFCHEIMGYIRTEFQERRKIDPSIMKSFKDILPYILKPKDYEAVQLKRLQTQAGPSNQELATSIMTAMGLSTDDGDEANAENAENPKDAEEGSKDTEDSPEDDNEGPEGAQESQKDANNNIADGSEGAEDGGHV